MVESGLNGCDSFLEALKALKMDHVWLTYL